MFCRDGSVHPPTEPAPRSIGAERGSIHHTLSKIGWVLASANRTAPAHGSRGGSGSWTRISRRRLGAARDPLRSPNQTRLLVASLRRGTLRPGTPRNAPAITGDAAGAFAPACGGPTMVEDPAGVSGLQRGRDDGSRYRRSLSRKSKTHEWRATTMGRRDAQRGGVAEARLASSTATTSYVTLSR